MTSDQTYRWNPYFIISSRVALSAWSYTWYTCTLIASFPRMTKKYNVNLTSLWRDSNRDYKTCKYLVFERFSGVLCLLGDQPQLAWLVSLLDCRFPCQLHDDAISLIILWGLHVSLLYDIGDVLVPTPNALYHLAQWRHGNTTHHQHEPKTVK